MEYWRLDSPDVGQVFNHVQDTALFLRLLNLLNDRIVWVSQAADRIAIPEGPNRSMRLTETDLPALFQVLYEYRERLDSGLCYTGGFLEASGGCLYAIRKIDRVNGGIRANLAVIEDLLVEIICPDDVVFSVEQMVRDHDYPDVNLNEIDDDWF